MNGVHDMGGMGNPGDLIIEENEPVFHAEWESRVLALTLAMLAAGYYNIDEMRSRTERMPSADYLTSPYYGKWLYALEKILLEKDVVTKSELEQQQSLRTDGKTLPAAPVEKIKYALTQPMPVNVAADLSPAFKVGDTIISKNMHPSSHTRLPRYARDKKGHIEKVHEMYRLPDSNAHGENDIVEYVYTVGFTARILWGDDAPAKDKVYLTLFESYMLAT